MKPNTLAEKRQFLTDNGWYQLWVNDWWVDSTVKYTDIDHAALYTEEAFRLCWNRYGELDDK